MTEPTDRLPWTSRSWSLLLVLYLPYAWILFEPASDYRTHWLLRWPLLPGLLPQTLFFQDMTGSGREIGAAIFSLVILAGGVAIGARGRTAHRITLIALLVYSLACGYGTRNLFLA